MTQEARIEAFRCERCMWQLPDCSPNVGCCPCVADDRLMGQRLRIALRAAEAHIAAADAVTTPPDDNANLVVEFVVPHYLFTQFDWDDVVGASVEMNDDDAGGPFHGFISGFENQLGDWLINIEDLDGNLIVRCGIGAVKRIVIS